MGSYILTVERSGDKRPRHDQHRDVRRRRLGLPGEGV